MYAIVDIAGQQFKVEKDSNIYVHRLSGNEGDKVEFEKVLLIDNDSKVVIGEPVINGAMVTAKIVSHLRGDKVIVFKKKRRKGYKVRNGHRQDLSEIQIEDIIETGAVKKAAPKAAVKPKVEVKAEEPKAEVKAEAKKKEAPKANAAEAKETKAAAKPKAAAKETKAPAKKAAPKKEAAAKKPAAKKPAAKKPAAKKTDKK